MTGTHQNHAYLRTHQFTFKVSGMLSFADSTETTVTESQPEISFVARSKQQIYKPKSGANVCLGINRFPLPVRFLNQTEFNKARLVT